MIALAQVIAALDVLSVASAPILVASLILLLASVVFALHPVRLIAAAAAALCVLPLAGPEIVAAQMGAGAAQAPLSLTIVTLNVMDGNSEQDRVEAFLRGARPDIIVLQEAREDVLTRLQGALPDYVTRVSCAFYPYCGVAILSRWPGTLRPQGYWIDHGLRGRGWRAPRLRYAAVTLHVPSSAGSVDVDVAGIHIAREGRYSFDRRQLADLAAVVDDLPNSQRAILAGDFNTAAPSHALQAFDAQIALVRRSHLLATWPAHLLGERTPPLIGIDQVYAAPAWRLADIRIGPNVGSDHRPILARLELDEAGTTPSRD